MNTLFHDLNRFVQTFTYIKLLQLTEKDEVLTPVEVMSVHLCLSVCLSHLG